MTNIHSIPSHQKLYDEASQWIVKMDKGLSADEQTALREWLQADQQGYQILMEMTQLWDKMDAMSRLSDLFEQPQPAKPFWQSDSWKSDSWTSYGPIAASVVLATVIGVWAIIGGGLFSPNNAIYQTAIGEQSTVMLPDGTQIILNTNTSVEVDYSNQARLLQLNSGELHIKVAKDPSRPLSVMAAGQVVQAIGTEFNIEITDKQKIELVVTEGKVKVGVQQAPDKTATDNQSATPTNQALTLAAGEQIMLGDPQPGEVTEVSAEEIAVKLSWRSGNLIFRGEFLEEAVKEIGRYTSVEFVFMNEDLKKMRVAGLFKAGDVEGLLATLRENFDIVSQRDEDGKVRLGVK